MIKIPKKHVDALKNLIASSEDWSLNEIAQLTGLMFVAEELDGMRANPEMTVNTSLVQQFQVGLRGLSKSANAKARTQTSAFSDSLKRAAERRAADR